MNLVFVDAAHRVNRMMPTYVVGRIAAMLAERGIAGEPARGSWRWASPTNRMYLMTESRRLLEVVELLMGAGSAVHVLDPMFTEADSRGSGLRPSVLTACARTT